MPDRPSAAIDVHYRPVATVDSDEEEWEEEDDARDAGEGVVADGGTVSFRAPYRGRGLAGNGRHSAHFHSYQPPWLGREVSRGGAVAAFVFVSLALLCVCAWLWLRSAGLLADWPIAAGDVTSLSGWLSRLSPATTDSRSPYPASSTRLSRPSILLPSTLPPSVASVRSCLHSHRTGRVLVLTVSTSRPPAVSHLLDAQKSDQPWCALLLAQSADVTYAVPSSEQPSVTFVDSSAQSALPYSTVSSSSSASLSHIRNVAYLIAVHAGASFIVDGDEALENTTLSAFHYRAATFPIGDNSARFTHCQPAVQILSAALPASSEPALASSHYAMNGDSDSRLLSRAGQQLTTAVMSPLFPLLWLPPSLSLSASTSLRSLAAMPVLSYLQVPTLDASLLRSDHPPAAAVRSVADAVSDDSGPSPAQLQQHYIQPCLIHGTELTPTSAAAPTQPSAHASPTSFSSGWLALLRSTERGHINDIQLALRDQLKREAVPVEEAVRASLHLDTLIEQLYSFLAHSNRSLPSGDDVHSLRAFHDDLRSIRHSVSAQLPSALVPATAVVLPRQERVSVCVMFNDVPYWHSLYTALHQHTALSRHVILSMPNATATMDVRTRQLLASYPDVAVQRCDSHHGYYQHNCLLQCLLQVRRDRHGTRGALWVADDSFFNLTQLFYYPQRWDVDEFWTHSRNYLLNVTAPWSSYHGAFGVQWHHWVTGIDFHSRLQQSYLAWPQQYRDALDSVYGTGRVATEALSDVLYVPAADGQMDYLVDVLSVQASSRVELWCETFTTIAIDIAMIRAGRRPNLPLWPFIDQQLSLYNVRPLDGVKRWIDGMQLYPASNVTEPNLLYNFLRRGAALTTNSTANWTGEMDSLLTQQRTPSHYAAPSSAQYQLGGCDADYSADGYPALASLRPVPIRPECHLADISTPQRSDWKLVRLCAESEGAGWVHPIKVSHREGERTMLSLELNQRVLLAVSRVLLEAEWADGRWCARHRSEQQQ